VVRVCGTWLAGLASAIPSEEGEEAAVSNSWSSADRSFSAHAIVLAALLLDVESGGHSVVCGLFVLLRASLFIAACRSRRNSASFVLRALLVAFTTEWYAVSISKAEKQ
jgi:hypothetical protein